jgi:hypothetical protein
MNSYLKPGEDDPGFGNHCQKDGKETQHFQGEPPADQATAQTWVDESPKGWLWAWVEW